MKTPCVCAEYDWTGCDLTAEHHPKCPTDQVINQVRAVAEKSNRKHRFKICGHLNFQYEDQIPVHSRCNVPIENVYLSYSPEDSAVLMTHVGSGCYSPLNDEDLEMVFGPIRPTFNIGGQEAVLIGFDWNAP
jgi:hypothetical protein